MFIKDGWKTTEGWVTFFTSVVTFATGIGVITMAEAEDFGEAIKNMSGGVTLIITGAGVVWKFIESRRSVKVEVAKANAEIAKIQPEAMKAMMHKQI